MEYLPPDYSKGKSNEELLKKLKSGNISINSGQLIVNELLERLVISQNK